jgi:tripartite-type tricarboxylate transporter receptor subunit TctC
VSRSICILRAACIALGLVVAGPGFAQSRDAADGYPNRPLRVVVGFSAGGPSDIIARVLAPRLFEPLGQPVLVDNRPGASGNIGAEFVAKAPADGYTILFGALGSASVSYALERKTLRYDLKADLAPITIVATVPFIFVVNPAVPAQSLSEFVAYAKAKPGQLSYASGGGNTPQRMAAEMFKLRTGVDMLHVPYKGGGQAMTDLIGGQVLTAFEAMPAALPHIKNAKLRPLAVATVERLPMLPEVPTMSEAGLPGFEVAGTFAMLAPARTPKPIIDRLNAELARILQLSDVKERLLHQGAFATSTTPEEATRRIHAEIAMWANVVDQADINPE